MVAIGHQAGLAIENTVFYNDKIQAERLAAVGQTIATLSHHIKNILQGIRGGSSLIDLGLKDKDESIVRRGWTIVEKNQTKIYNLVMDMLSFSKDREPDLELADLNETIGDVVRAHAVPRGRAGSRAELAAERPAPSHHDRHRGHPPGRLEHRDQCHRRLRGLSRTPRSRSRPSGTPRPRSRASASATTGSESTRPRSRRSFSYSPRPRAPAAPGWACPSRRKSSASTEARSRSHPAGAGLDLRDRAARDQAL